MLIRSTWSSLEQAWTSLVVNTFMSTHVGAKDKRSQVHAHSIRALANTMGRVKIKTNIFAQINLSKYLAIEMLMFYFSRKKKRTSNVKLLSSSYQINCVELLIGY